MIVFGWKRFPLERALTKTLIRDLPDSRDNAFIVSDTNRFRLRRHSLAQPTLNVLNVLRGPRGRWCASLGYTTVAANMFNR